MALLAAARQARRRADDVDHRLPGGLRADAGRGRQVEEARIAVAAAGVRDVVLERDVGRAAIAVAGPGAVPQPPEAEAAMEAEAAEMPEAAVMVEAVQPGVAEDVMAMAEGGDPAAAPEAVAAPRRRERVRREGAEGKQSSGKSEKGERRRMYDTP